MLFNSYLFVLAFLPIVLIGYFGLNHFHKYSAAKVFLIIASLFFYGYFNWWYLLIIISSVGLNYLFSRVMLREKTNKAVRKIVFAIALTLNIGSLVFFKYYDFFISNVNAIFKTDWPLLHILLPLGISFFTFQQLSYVIDSYKRDKNIAAYNFFDYALFVTYFPQLIAGPIVTHDEMVPQFADVGKKKFNYDNFAAGLYGFAFGLGKKVIIADTFGLPLPPYAVYNIGNSNPENWLDFVSILQEELVRAGVLPSDYNFEEHKKLVPMQPGDVPVTYADTSALERDFGFKPSTSLRDGLRVFAEWCKEFYCI